MTAAAGATERRSIDQAIALLDGKMRHAAAVINRLRRIADIPPGARILDVGSAQGYFLIACSRMGLDVVGV